MIALAASFLLAAAEFHDPGSGLSVDLSSMAGQVCWIAPAPLRDDAACAGLDVGNAEKALHPSLKMLAIVREPGFSYSVVASTMPRAPGSEISIDDAADYFRGAAADAQKNDPAARIRGIRSPLDPGDRLLFDGLPALRYVVSSPKAESGGMGGGNISYAFFGAKDVAVLVFLSDAAHLDALARRAEAITASVSLPCDRLGRWKSRASLRVEQWNWLAIPLLSLVVAVETLVLLRRRKSAA